MRHLAAVAVCLVCVACSTTHLAVRRVTPDSKPEDRVGIYYPLPFTQHKIEITRQIAECGKELKATITADVKDAVIAPDPSQEYVLDPNSLASTFKTSSVKVGYHPTGAVASVNAVADDRTAEVAANVAATVVKVAVIAAAAAAPQTAEGEDKACSPEVIAALAEIKKQTPVVAAAAKLVTVRTEELKALDAKVARLGANADAKTKAALASAYDALERATADLANKTGALKKPLAVVTNTQTVYWPTNGDTGDGVFAMERSALTKWGSLDINPKTLKTLEVHMALAKTGAGRIMSQADGLAEPPGLPYRQPQPGRITVCAGGPCSDDNAPIAQRDELVLQLGFIHYLPCESRAFSSITCAYKANASGQLEELGTENKKAVAEGASAMAKDIATQAGSLQETLSSAKTKKLEAETAALKAQADYQSAKAALQPNPNQADVDALASIKARTEMINAQRAELEAQAALDAALTKQAAP